MRKGPYILPYIIGSFISHNSQDVTVRYLHELIIEEENNENEGMNLMTAFCY